MTNNEFISEFQLQGFVIEMCYTYHNEKVFKTTSWEPDFNRKIYKTEESAIDAIIQRNILNDIQYRVVPVYTKRKKEGIIYNKETIKNKLK